MKAIIFALVLLLFGLGGLSQAANDEAPESGPIVPAPHWGPPTEPASTSAHGDVKIEDVRASSRLPRPAVDFFDPRLSRTPPILADPNNYGTENNWLACVIARRLVDFALLIRHEDALKSAAITVTANVDAAQRKVHLEIRIPSQPTVTIDLQPDFAWDGHGYAPLATVLLGHAPGENPGKPLPDLLGDLQNLTGLQLAAKDVELSRLLQKHPAWAAAHEEAALLLVALALRDNAGDYSDSRRMLCRATAHLALAEALRGADAPTWAGRIADAGIRALSGREVDALAHLDALAAEASSPAAVKPWIDAFRLRAKDDWRVVTPDASAPLLTKIAYFRTLQDKLTPLPALKRFEPLGDLVPVTDWGHAVMANELGASVQTSNQFDQATLNLELEELGRVLASEGGSFDAVHEPGKQLSQPLVEQLCSGPNGELRVIGPDMFKDYARRHLLLEMIRTRQWLENLLGLADDAETFRETMWSNFQGMRMMEVTYDFAKESEHKTPEEQVVAEGVKWYPWEIAAGDLSNSFANTRDQVMAAQFYKDGLPFGTAYNLAVRARTLEDGAVGRPEIPHENPRAMVMDYVENSAYLHDHPFGGDALQRMILGPHAPSLIYPPVADLRSLAPDSFELFAYNRPLADLFANSRSWWDYDLTAIYRIEHYKALLDDATLGELLRKHAALEPDAYFQLGQELRAEGKTDEAADADRKGFDQGYDEVGKASLIGPLVELLFRSRPARRGAEVGQDGSGDILGDGPDDVL
jgi:hypothetical protein